MGSTGREAVVGGKPGCEVGELGERRGGFRADKDFTLKESSDANGSARLPGTGSAAYLLVFGAAGAVIGVSIA